MLQPSLVHHWRQNWNWNWSDGRRRWNNCWISPKNQRWQPGSAHDAAFAHKSNLSTKVVAAMEKMPVNAMASVRQSKEERKTLQRAKERIQLDWRIARYFHTYECIVRPLGNPHWHPSGFWWAGFDFAAVLVHPIDVLSVLCQYGDHVKYMGVLHSWVVFLNPTLLITIYRTCLHQRWYDKLFWFCHWLYHDTLYCTWNCSIWEKCLSGRVHQVTSRPAVRVFWRTFQVVRLLAIDLHVDANFAGSWNLKDLLVPIFTTMKELQRTSKINTMWGGGQ